jgi:hypothetical protein
MQCTVESLTLCLEVWAFYVSHVFGKSELNDGEIDIEDAPSLPILYQLVMKLLQQIQFSNRVSAEVLATLDDGDTTGRNRKVCRMRNYHVTIMFVKHLPNYLFCT